MLTKLANPLPRRSPDHALGVTDHILPEEGVHWVSPVFPVRIVSGTPKNADRRSTPNCAGSASTTCRRR
jgi:hypothetical protein